MLLSKFHKISTLIIVLVTSQLIHAQTISADFQDKNIVYTNGASNVSFNAKLGINSDEFAYGLHGITFNIEFDPSVIYADSLHIKANPQTLGLNPSEYMEMHRVDSAYALYSIVLKGRGKTLQMSTLPLVLNFKIKPEISQKLIENDCNYQIHFATTNLKAQDSKQIELEIEPFDFAIDIDCDVLKHKRRVSASPNPTKGKSWFNIPHDMLESIEQIYIYDMNGVLISAELRQSDNIFEVDLSQYKSGLYLVMIVYDKWEKDVIKIIKI